MADKLMRTAVVMSFSLVMALFSGCGANRTSLTAADNGNQITVNSGDTLTLTLESNPTTGYSWQVMEIDNAILAMEGDPEYKHHRVLKDWLGQAVRKPSALEPF